MVSLIRQKGVDQDIGFDLFRPLLNDVCGMVGGALSMLENITEIMPGTTWVPKLRSSRDVLRKCKIILLASMHYAQSPEEYNYDDLGSHFLKPELFQIEYLDVISFSVSLSI